MADNLTTQTGTLATIPTSSTISTEEITTLNAGAVGAQHVQRVAAALRTADGAAIDLPGDAANGLDVDVTRLPALVAGSAKIGAVDLDSDATTGAAVPVAAQFVAGTDGTNARALKTDAAGELQVDVLTLPALVAGNANIGDVDLASVGAGVSIEAVGDVAHDAVAAGNPVLLAGFAETPEDTAPANQVSAEADATRLATDRDGALFTHPHPPRIWHVATEYTTQQTDASVKAAPGAGLSLYLTDIYIQVDTASLDVTLEEGTTTLKFKLYGQNAGDGVSRGFGAPLKFTANTALTVTSSGAGTFTLVVSGYTAP